MSATLGAALKKIAVALLADRKNWEKLAVALFAVLLLFLLPILSVEAIFQADMDWDSPELVSLPCWRTWTWAAWASWRAPTAC